VLLAYDFGDLMWSFLVFFGWIIFFWLLFVVFGDLFARHDVSGWGKAAWTVFVIIIPFLGVLVYLIANGQGMAERSARRAQSAQTQADDYIRSVAGGSAEQIAKAKQLLDSGAITQAEYDQLKARALAGA
jgi:hypothetical protein